jgi:histone chaperone ASF1
MALVNVTNVIVLDNPTIFSNDFQFEIEFECLGELEDDLEWRVTYVGSAEDQTRDQVLEEVMVGPVPQGVSKFVLTAEPPKTDLIPLKDLVGVTVVLITCSYKDKEFVRIGYYVNNEYYHTNPLVNLNNGSPTSQLSAAESEVPQPVGEEELIAMIEAGTLDPTKVYRNIMSDKPRVTRFQIDWVPEAMKNAFPTSSSSLEQEQQQQQFEQQLGQHQQQQQFQQQQFEQQQMQFQQQHYQQEMNMSGGLPVPPMY